MNITVLGASGDASGQYLSEVACKDVKCADAVEACAAFSGCDTVEMRLPSLQTGKAKERRRRNGSLMASATPKAILRASWTSWGAHDPKLSRAVKECQRLTSIARQLPSGEWLSKQWRLAWQQGYCDEYVASRSQPLPDLGRLLTPAEMKAPNGPSCPVAGTKLVLVSYQNGPSPWLCTFLRTLGYRDVHISVLGWQPQERVRLNNVFYFTDRVYTLLRYLQTCARIGALAPETTIMFCDSDELYQLHGGLPELWHRSKLLLDRTGANVILSAEARCMPNRLGAASWAHSMASVEVLRTSKPITVKKWPRCLNTGNFVGSVTASIDMLNQTCIPCRDGMPIEDIHRRYSRAYSAQVKGWIYSEQAELMSLYLARPANETGWLLDFGQELFHPSFWFTAQWDTRVLPDGRIRNRHTSSTPAFMHYNGDSKRTWKGAHSPKSLAQALRGAYVRRTGDTNLAALDAYLRDRVSFLGPTFKRDTNVRWQDVCRDGSIGG